MKLQLFGWMKRCDDERGTRRDSDLERLCIAGAVVQRQGDHYWIVSGGDRPEDLPLQGTEAQPPTPTR